MNQAKGGNQAKMETRAHLDFQVRKETQANQVYQVAMARGVKKETAASQGLRVRW